MWFFRKKKKIGLVLGSGGARGMAHIGVIKVLMNNRVPIDLVTGSSVGAFIGGMFASSGRIEPLERMMRGVTYQDIAKILVDPTWGGGLVKGKKTLEFLEGLFDKQRIEDLRIPFSAVATDIVTARPVIFNTGDLARAVRASISVPLVYSPVLDGKSLLVDGGVSCPVPVEVARAMDADVVIAVNLDGVYFSGDNHKNDHQVSTIDVLKDSYFALRYNLAKKEVAGADIVIEPVMKYIEDFDFVGGMEAIKAGEEATEIMIEKIKKLV